MERVKGTDAPFYRPPLPEQESAGVHPVILTLMKQCWAEEPAERPTFVEVTKILKTINKGKSVLCSLHVAVIQHSVCRSLKETESVQLFKLTPFFHHAIFWHMHMSWHFSLAGRANSVAA